MLSLALTVDQDEPMAIPISPVFLSSKALTLSVSFLHVSVPAEVDNIFQSFAQFKEMIALVAPPTYNPRAEPVNGEGLTHQKFPFPRVSMEEKIVPGVAPPISSGFVGVFVRIHSLLFTASQ